MTAPDLPAVTLFVIQELEKLDVSYQVGGSLASSALGVPRATLDADLVADIGEEHAQPLAASLGPAFYVSAEMICEAVRHRSSFNVLHIASGFKVDVFVLKDRPFDRQAFARTILRPWPGELQRQVPFCTAEDIVLYKLEWYQMGKGISDRQWHDVVGVLRVQGERLDREYLLQWAKELKVSDLLQCASEQSGIDV